MAHRPLLSLEVSMGKDDDFADMENTYRREGLTIGADYMRILGNEVQMEVLFTDLALGKRIGQGACSTVHVAQHRHTGEYYAVKMFNVYDEGQSRQLQREICLLAYVRCDALVSLKGAFHNEGSIGVIIEYMDRGSLEYLLDEHIDVTEPVMAAIMYQILWGLGYLHYDNRMHRDIKPANVLLNSRGEVKLSDFGISRTLESTFAMSSTSVGSFRYMSPERLLGEEYGASGDIWSVGIMMIQLWTKVYPFGGNIVTPIDLLTEVEQINVDRILRGGPRAVPPTMAKVTSAMLNRDPSHRATCMELLDFSWFQGNGVNSIIDAQHTVAVWLDGPDHRARGAAGATGTGLGSHGHLACTSSSDGTGISRQERQSSVGSVQYEEDFEPVEFDGEGSATFMSDDGGGRDGRGVGVGVGGGGGGGGGSSSSSSNSSSSYGSRGFPQETKYGGDDVRYRYK